MGSFSKKRARPLRRNTWPRNRPPLLWLILIAAAYFYWAGFAGSPPLPQEKGPSNQKEFSGRVKRVADGDSIELWQAGRTIKIRLYGIDAPELNQDHGPETRDWLASRLLGKNARIETMDTDQYGRVVALVFVDEGLINQALVASGQAWVYKRYCAIDLCGQMQKDQTEARQKKLGLWGQENTPVPPWQWRRANPSRR